MTLDWTEPLDKPDSLQPYLFRKKDTVWTQEEEELIARVLREKNCSLTNSPSSDIYCANYFASDGTSFTDYSSWVHKKGGEIHFSFCSCIPKRKKSTSIAW